MGCRVNEPGGLENVEPEAREQCVLQVPLVILLREFHCPPLEFERAPLPIAIEIGNL
jgi:hypothetical protein